MMDLEIPLGKRTKKYRFFEILPGFFSYGAIILLIVLSIFNPLLASIYLLIIISKVYRYLLSSGRRTQYDGEGLKYRLEQTLGGFG